MIKIEMQNVSIGYSHKPILKDINIEVLPGQLVGLIGPNGSGKSTIIRALTRVIGLLEGNIIIDGKNIKQISRHDLARIMGVVPQVPLLPSAFTAFEVVLMGRNPHLGMFRNESEREVEITLRAMERTMTRHLVNRRVGELSGGEIQCLLIARALTQETKAILLDEPTANLDVGRQIEILNLIKQLCAEKNVAVLAALHDLNLAVQYCDRLVLINQGRVHAQGTPEEVITASNVRDVYGAEECVYTHPANGRPTVLINPENIRLFTRNSYEEHNN
ncbi:MAG: ABC transporter ATP-binding protein [Dehalococcoidales bacterium]|nr:ABC transporter ATP-binding protein [Dehalococcoidales bacterium]